MQLDILAQGAITGVFVGGIVALIALGLTLIWGIMGVLNLAHASFVMVAMFASYALVKYLGIHPYLTIFVIVPVFFFFGILVSEYLIKPAKAVSDSLALLITIAIMMFLESGMTLIQLKVLKESFVSIDPKYWIGTVNIGDVVIDIPAAIAFFASIGMALLLYWLIRRTEIGRHIRACSENPEVTSVMGINVGRTQLIGFGIGIGSAGAAATLMLPSMAFDAGIGASFLLTAFVVVVLGGLGNFVGTLIAGFIVGFAEGVAGVLIPGSMVPAVGLGILFLVLLFKPQGIFGERGL